LKSPEGVAQPGAPAAGAPAAQKHIFSGFSAGVAKAEALGTNLNKIRRIEEINLFTFIIIFLTNLDVNLIIKLLSVHH